MRGRNLFVVSIGCLAGMLNVVGLSQNRDPGPSATAEVAERLRSRGRFSNSDGGTTPTEKPGRKRILATRRWVDKQGGPIITAAFVTYKSGKVALRDPAGRSYTIPWDSLSEPCKSYVNYKINGSTSVREPQLLIYALLKNRSPQVRQAKAIQLGNANEVDREMVVEALLEALGDPSPVVQIAAISSLSRFREKSMLPYLEKLAENEALAPAVAKAAMDAMHEFYGLPEPMDELIDPMDKELLVASNDVIQRKVDRWIKDHVQGVQRIGEYEKCHQRLRTILRAISEQNSHLLQHSLAELVNFSLPKEGHASLFGSAASFGVEMVQQLLRDAGAGGYQLAFGEQRISLAQVIQRTVDGILAEQLSWEEFVLSGNIQKVVAGEDVDREPTPQEIVLKQTRRFSTAPELRDLFAQLLLLREIALETPVTN